MRGILRQFVVGLAVFSPAAFALPSSSEPRSSEEMSVGGVPHLARMADKAALASEHRLSADLEYPCPKDRKLLAKLSMGADEFQSLVGASSSDAELDMKLKNAAPAAYEAAKAALLRFARAKQSKMEANLNLRPQKHGKHGKHGKPRNHQTHRKGLAEDADGC